MALGSKGFVSSTLILSSLEFEGKTIFCLPGNWIPLLSIKDEEHDRGIASNTGMNELLSYLGLGGGDMESGRESGVLNINVHSQNIISFGRRCYLFTSQCSYCSVS
jgi:hypothetical protein